MRPDRIQAIKRLPVNTKGRDLVVGDLHGCRSYLEEELDRLNFDPAADRVIGCGDLIDRGPESLRTLGLLREPWFHTVIDNHAAMMLTYFGRYFSHMHRPYDFTNNGGIWVEDHLENRAPNAELTELLDRVMALPSVLCVDAEIPFNVTHGELPFGAKSQAELLSFEAMRTLDRHIADEAVWARDQIKRVTRGPLSKVDIDGRDVVLSNTPINPNLNLTYVGHTVLKHPLMHGSYAYIDTGAFKRVTTGEKQFSLTVVDHEQFAPKLLAAARPKAGARSKIGS